MTAHRDERGPGGPIDRDLTEGYEAFTAKVERALDVETGLRDILSQASHEAFTAKVETALGVEAGLRDILTPSSDQMPSSPSPAVVPPAANATPGGNRWQASPAQRLKLRSNPRVAAASHVLRAVGSWIDDSVRDRDRDRALDRDYAFDPARALARALSLARVRDHDLVHALSDVRTRVLDHVRSRCLQIINEEYAQTVGTPVAVDEESLTNLLDDFTTDDLSDADVREGDIKLAGVKWSDGTTWPASTDIDYLKRRSDRQEDGSWIIRAGTGNVPENVLT
ncbi:hypothetical protein ACFWBR_29830 [Streptomyces sp. NPDC060006]|uniref:hypothetical protein n=1 Tax=unclassified Streptomyces TaxID=2593676 RepID=UPI0036987E24